MVLGATNLPWDLDDAIRRRLEKRIYIPLPDSDTRQELFKLNLSCLPLDPGVRFEELAKLSDGYSGADISIVCRDASMMGIRKLRQTGLNLRQMRELKDKMMKQKEDEHSGTQSTQTLVNKNSQNIQNILEAPITMENLRESLQKVSSSVSHQDLAKFENWMNEFGSS